MSIVFDLGVSAREIVDVDLISTHLRWPSLSLENSQCFVLSILKFQEHV